MISLPDVFDNDVFRNYFSPETYIDPLNKPSLLIKNLKKSTHRKLFIRSMRKSTGDYCKIIKKLILCNQLLIYSDMIN